MVKEFVRRAHDPEAEMVLDAVQQEREAWRGHAENIEWGELRISKVEGRSGLTVHLEVIADNVDPAYLAAPKGFPIPDGSLMYRGGLAYFRDRSSDEGPELPRARRSEYTPPKLNRRQHFGFDPDHVGHPQ